MSVKVMAWVWDLEMPVKEKFVMLAYADHADHDGGSIFPAIATIAKKTGYSPRSIQRITRTLESNGYLIPDGSHLGGRGKSNRWKMPIYGGLKGDLTDTLSESKRVTTKTERVTKAAVKGDVAMSPEPSSLTTKDSSEKESDFKIVIKEWEKSVGPITGGIAEELGSMVDECQEYVGRMPPGLKGEKLGGEGWVIHAIKTARKSATGKFNVKYVQAILDRWMRDGFDSKFVRAEAEAYTTGAGKGFWDE